MPYYFTQQIFIPAPSKLIYQYFTNLSNLLEIHPLITAVEIIKTERDAYGNTICDFKVREEPKFLGLIKVDVLVQGHYKCNALHQEVEITTIARTRKIELDIQDTFEFKQIEQGTQVTEDVRVSGTPIFYHYSGWKAKRVHREVLQRLRARMIQMHHQSTLEPLQQVDSLLKDKING